MARLLSPLAERSRFLDIDVLPKSTLLGWVGAERRSALQRARLALVLPTHKRKFARGRPQLRSSSAYGRGGL